MIRMIADNHQELDAEWVELMLYARAKGLTTEEVKKIFHILQEEREQHIQESAV